MGIYSRSNVICYFFTDPPTSPNVIMFNSSSICFSVNSSKEVEVSITYVLYTHGESSVTRGSLTGFSPLCDNYQFPNTCNEYHVNTSVTNIAGMIQHTESFISNFGQCQGLSLNYLVNSQSQQVSVFCKFVSNAIYNVNVVASSM